MVELLAAAAAFVAVTALGGAVLAGRRVRRAPLDDRLRELEGKTAPPVAAKKAPPLQEAISQLGKAVSSGKTSTKLQAELVKAGFNGPHTAATYMGAKILCLAVGLVTTLIATAAADMSIQAKGFLAVAAAVGLSFGPNIYVATLKKKRQTDVQSHLPDMLDLIEICVSAGMGIDQAWNAVTDEVRQVSTILSDEMALTNLEIHLGSTRGQAMRHMAERTSNEELSSLVAVLIQSERFGTSVGEALRSFAESVRTERSRRAEEHAEKMAVKLLLPMILFIFPTILIVVVGPAGLTLVKMMMSD